MLVERFRDEPSLGVESVDELVAVVRQDLPCILIQIGGVLGEYLPDPHDLDALHVEETHEPVNRFEDIRKH